MKKAYLYVHGRGGNAAEAGHYAAVLPGCDVFGAEYRGETPWDTETELREAFERLTAEYDSVGVIANSIGAYYILNALGNGPDCRIARAFFISPIVDMERLILDMLAWNGSTEAQLREAGEIRTSFGETLSWRYLRYAREHPLRWNEPTRILYGERDNLTDFETVSAFAGRIGADLTVMQGGEHWFHTEEQTAFLDEWLRGNK